MKGALAMVASALLGASLLLACPGPRGGKAVPAPVEIDWPDAAAQPEAALVDAGAPTRTDSQPAP